MRPLIFLFALITILFFQDESSDPKFGQIGECTIGVFSGRATTDGRPILWKNRDVTNAVQKFCYYAPTCCPGETTLAFVANAYSADTSRVYMGLNEAGFGIINANSYNLGDYMIDGVDDGRIIRMALESCRTLADFEHILDLTSVEGRKDCWNFGAIDAFGHAAMYESANQRYVKYDADDSLNEADGVIIRATFSLSGDGNHDGLPRYKRAIHLVRERLSQQPVDVPFILQTLARDLVNPLDDPYPLPYDRSQNGKPSGFILTRDVTINRDISRSCAVIRGVAAGQDTRLATVYGMIGPPVISVAYPMWVQGGSIPLMLNAGSEVPMYQYMARHRLKLYPLRGDPYYLNTRHLIGKNGIGIYTYTLPLETEILGIVEDSLASWEHTVPDSSVFAAAENQLAQRIYDTYIGIPTEFPDDIVEGALSGIAISSYPNPFNASTAIDLAGFAEGEQAQVEIYNLMGQRVRELPGLGGPGSAVVWNGRDNRDEPVSSGVYLIKAIGSQHSATTKSVLLK